MNVVTRPTRPVFSPFERERKIFRRESFVVLQHYSRSRYFETCSKPVGAMRLQSLSPSAGRFCGIARKTREWSVKLCLPRASRSLTSVKIELDALERRSSQRRGGRSVTLVNLHENKCTVLHQHTGPYDGLLARFAGRCVRARLCEVSPSFSKCGERMTLAEKRQNHFKID